MSDPLRKQTGHAQSSITHRNDFLTRLDVPQARCSSEPSAQSASPSHTNTREMHSPPVKHLNCWELQVANAKSPMWRTYQKCFDFMVKPASLTRYLRQFCSSESSAQSLIPSHLQFWSMHWPLLHWNWSLAHRPAQKWLVGLRLNCHFKYDKTWLLVVPSNLTNELGVHLVKINFTVFKDSLQRNLFAEMCWLW